MATAACTTQNGELSEISNNGIKYEDEQVFEENVPQLKFIKVNDQVRRLQTIIRDKNTTRSEFVFSADRLIRLVIEEGLNFLPYAKHSVTTTSGYTYQGVKFGKGSCGVSIIRSGEAMEKALQDSCRSIRIGKVLVQSDDETNQAKVFYAKFPKDISERTVLLMYPILSTGNTVLKAVEVLRDYGVSDSSIILLTLFSTPQGVTSVSSQHPEITILSTELHSTAPVHFGQKYFGTE